MTSVLPRATEFLLGDAGLVRHDATTDIMTSEKEKAAFWSIIASTMITLGKGAAGLASGSLALMSDAAHSLLDIAATTMTYLAIRAASKPADDEHHYGHGKVESIAALIETAFLFLLSGAVAIEGVRRLWTSHPPIEVHWLAIAVLIASIVIDAWRWWSLNRVAKMTGSEALAADALHFVSDLINSALVLAAFGAVALGYPQADALVAVGVAIFIAVAGFRLARRTIDTLLDAAPAGSAQAIRALIEDISGVVTIDSIRVRPVGATLFADIEISVARTNSLEQLSAIKSLIVASVRSAFADANVTVTATPKALDEETVLERVLLIAAKRRVPVHHVTVQDISGVLSVSLDVEVDGRLSLARAHAVASDLEHAIREELGDATEVETHIEPLVVSSLIGRTIAGQPHDEIAASLARNALASGRIDDIHNVRVRETEHGYVVNYHCRIDQDCEVTRVHEAVDRLEQQVRAEFPAIVRIVSHTEPLPQKA